MGGEWLPVAFSLAAPNSRKRVTRIQPSFQMGERELPCLYLNRQWEWEWGDLTLNCTGEG